MKKQSDPSNPVNLDSGQREELTYIIESLKKTIYVPRKEGRGEKARSQDSEEGHGSSLTRRPVTTGRYTILADRNLLAIAEGIPA
jgi:hypothetical protein